VIDLAYVLVRIGLFEKTMAAISFCGDAAIRFLPVDHAIRLCRIAIGRNRIAVATWRFRSSLASGFDTKTIDLAAIY
jgi:hypothetical protein